MMGRGRTSDQRCCADSISLLGPHLNKEETGTGARLRALQQAQAGCAGEAS